MTRAASSFQARAIPALAATASAAVGEPVPNERRADVEYCSEPCRTRRAIVVRAGPVGPRREGDKTALVSGHLENIGGFFVGR